MTLLGYIVCGICHQQIPMTLPDPSGDRIIVSADNGDHAEAFLHVWADHPECAPAARVELRAR